MKTKKLTEEEVKLLERLKYLHFKLSSHNGGISSDEYDEYESIKETLSMTLPINY